MKRNQLDTHEVVTRGDARRHVEVLPAVVIDHTVDTPLTIASGEAVLSDLEPLEATSVGRGGVRDLGEIDHGRPCSTDEPSR